jgi:hypothetical protein
MKGIVRQFGYSLESLEFPCILVTFTEFYFFYLNILQLLGSKIYFLDLDEVYCFTSICLIFPSKLVMIALFKDGLTTNSIYNNGN